MCFVDAIMIREVYNAMLRHELTVNHNIFWITPVIAILFSYWSAFLFYKKIVKSTNDAETPSTKEDNIGETEDGQTNSAEN